jgi:hypothetical protein
MSKQKIKWNDIAEGGREAIKYYNLSQRETEQQLRNHLDGASPKERREMYELLYAKRK